MFCLTLKIIKYRENEENFFKSFAYTFIAIVAFIPGDCKCTNANERSCVNTSDVCLGK